MGSMINKQFFQELKQAYSQKEQEREEIIKHSNKVLHESKRSIFSLHRKEVDQAEAKLQEIESSINNLQNEFGFTRVNEEGSYKAAIEEYVEARFFSRLLQGEEISEIKEVKLRFDSYLAGLCDVPGELTRLAANEAAVGRSDKVTEYKDIVVQIIDELSEFDMTGYLRTKFDQAQSALRKIEQINYEVKIRKNC
jgi:translin